MVIGGGGDTVHETATPTCPPKIFSPVTHLQLVKHEWYVYGMHIFNARHICKGYCSHV